MEELVQLESVWSLPLPTCGTTVLIERSVPELEGPPPWDRHEPELAPRAALVARHGKDVRALRDDYLLDLASPETGRVLDGLVASAKFPITFVHACREADSCPHVVLPGLIRVESDHPATRKGTATHLVSSLLAAGKDTVALRRALQVLFEEGRSWRRELRPILVAEVRERGLGETYRKKDRDAIVIEVVSRLSEMLGAKLSQFDPKRGRVTAWLMYWTRHAVREVLNERLRDIQHKDKGMQIAKQRPGRRPETEPPLKAEKNERKTIIARLMDELEARIGTSAVGRAYLLRLLSGVTWAELSDATGIPLSTIRAQVMRHAADVKKDPTLVALSFELAQNLKLSTE